MINRFILIIFIAYFFTGIAITIIPKYNMLSGLTDVKCRLAYTSSRYHLDDDTINGSITFYHNGIEKTKNIGFIENKSDWYILVDQYHNQEYLNCSINLIDEKIMKQSLALEMAADRFNEFCFDVLVIAIVFICSLIFSLINFVPFPILNSIGVIFLIPVCLFYERKFTL